MGVYYYPKKKKSVESLLSSIWQTDFYGLLYRFAVQKSTASIYREPMPRMPYTATKGEAADIAAAIRGEFENNRAELMKYLADNGRLGHVEEPLREKLVADVINELLEFLEKCGGYEAN